MAAGFKTAQVNAASVPSTQTNFPSYVDLSRLGITTLAEAQSVRVYADSGKTTEWAREIVSVTEMHVKVPSLTSTVVMYVDWDGVRADYAVTDTYGRNAVWTGFTSVYHMDSVTADSTVNANTLTNTGSTGTTTGKLNGSAADFGATNTTKKLTAGNLGIGGNGSISMSQWFQTASTPGVGSQPVIISHRSTTGSDRYIDTYYRNDAGTLSIYTGEGGIKTARYIITLSLNTWYKLRTERDVTAGIYRIYLNGVLQASSTAPLPSGTAAQNGFAVAEFVGGGGFWWSGLEDEVRVTTTIPTANWETTEYNNQSDEPTFWGTWSNAGTTPRGGVLLDW